MTKHPALVPAHTVRYFGAGEHCADPMLGDLVLIRHAGFVASVIRFGERLRLHGEDRIYAAVNHAATVVDPGPNPKIQEMVGRGGVVSDLRTYVDVAYAVVNTTRATQAQRMTAKAAALYYVGIGYSYLSIASDSLYLLTGLPIALTIGASVVCSADASTAQRCLGFVPGKPDLAVLPSDLARWFDVRLPIGN